jgi:hypothetical protein
MFSNNDSNLISIIGYFLVFKNRKASVICSVANHHNKKGTESKTERPKTIHLEAWIMLRVKDIPACTCKHADRHSQCKS